MTGRKLYCLLLFMAFAIPSISFARDIPPFVSTDWLGKNLTIPGLLIIDIRNATDYGKNHIPNAINVSINSWAINRNGLLRELPATQDLLGLMGSIGLRDDSKVVVAGKGISDFDRADAIRAAWTLLVAGVKNVSVLDGGFSKWLDEKKAVTAEQPRLQPGDYRGKINLSALAAKKYLLSKIGKSVVVDNRTPELFFGMTTESWAPKPGHIKSATNLPAPWAFQPNGLLRSQSELESMANNVIGTNKTKEVITYCGVGAYASVWSYILTELLGYKNVKVYDGSMQEWVIPPVGPITIHSWH
jgi:thiosulfate/3-mercaptopyruvate sulfurtransferase